MTDRHVLARSYLAPPIQSFWRWSPDGEVIEWVDGTTIAFRQEIECVLARLAPHGFPPLGSVVLLLAACRDAWRGSQGSSEIVHGLVRWLSSQGLKISNDWLRDLWDGLDCVHKLPADLRTTLDAKATLAEVVFEDAAHRWTAEDSTQVSLALREGVVADALLPDPVKKVALEWFRIERNALVRGLKLVDAESLRRRARTGLDRLVQPAPIELLPADLVRKLIRDLRSDKELPGLGRLAHHLMAAVHIPRAISTPDELPVGGVSDIANRGPLDRLLVSELAHDDLTLAVRVALNEALYLRRETPPRVPPSHRALLIDSGIRLWGIPRVFATAVALALAATADRSTQLTAYRASGNGLVPVDLTTRQGLEEHLQAIDPQPHPATALPLFFDFASHSGGAIDRILITHHDVLKDSEFRAALRKFQSAPLYVATVSRDGAFQLLAVSDGGDRTLRTAQLALDELLAPPKVALHGVPLVTESHDPSLPLILTLHDFPLRMPHTIDPNRLRFAEQVGAVAVTHDGRLMHWNKSGYGARQLSEVVPSGTLRWFSLSGTIARLVFERPGQGTIEVFSADLESGECRSTKCQVSRERTLAVHVDSEVLMRIVSREVQVFSLHTGAQVGSLNLPDGVEWRHDRFFSGRDDWYALGWDGSGARLDLVTAESSDTRRKILRLFDRSGMDGPWAITSEGDAVSTADATHIEFQHGPNLQVWVTGVSPDGNRVSIRTSSADRLPEMKIRESVLELSTRTVHPVRRRSELATLLAPDVRRVIRARNLRCSFRGISLDAHRQLALVTKTNQWLSITLDAGRDRLLLRPDHAAKPLESSQWTYVGVDPGATVVERPEPVQPFLPTHGPGGTRYKLRRAVWQDGSRAYLDSRGLLHLLSRESGLHQVTIVLDLGELAVCCLKPLAKPVVAGPVYFIGDASPVPAWAAYDVIRRFVENLR